MGTVKSHTLTHFFFAGSELIQTQKIPRSLKITSSHMFAVAIFEKCHWIFIRLSVTFPVLPHIELHQHAFGALIVKVDPTVCRQLHISALAGTVYHNCINLI